MRKQRREWLWAAGLVVLVLAIQGAVRLLAPYGLTVEGESAGAASRELAYVVHNRTSAPLAVGLEPKAALFRREGENWLDTGAGQELRSDVGLELGAFSSGNFTLSLEEPLEPGEYRLTVEASPSGKEPILLEKTFQVE